MNIREALGLEKREGNQSVEDYAIELIKAKQEWEDAQSYFTSVTDDALVDFAIFDMEAAKMRYFYLLKKVRAIWDEEKAKGTA